MDSDLPKRLRELGEVLAGARGVAGVLTSPDFEAALQDASDRLSRDLLPRTAGGHTHLVVGIVGPNNAGKSALFNALVGRAVSPSLPTGGATRRLVGCAHPDLRAAFLREPTLAQFPLADARVEAGGVQAALEAGADPAQLFLVDEESLPPSLLLIDTPDFDSILEDNRRASESLLRVVDLAVVVVTRHTYQNREVVQFLESWLAHGRPWMLCYNESLGGVTTTEHASKLAADLGSEPVAVFHSPFDLRVAQGEQRLAPRGLSGAGVGPETDLRAWLFDQRSTEELKQTALAASLTQLRVSVEAVVRSLAESGRRTEQCALRARAVGGELARGVAAQAMPMEPFLTAFREVLDARPSLLQRGMRGALRRGRLFLESALARIPRFGKSVQQAPVEVQLGEVERRALDAAYPAFYEALSQRMLGLDTQAETPRALWESLRRDLAPANADRSRERVLASIPVGEEVLDEFRAACTRLIEEELDRRGSDWFLQIAVDVVHLLPAVAAGFVIFKTGGLGSDLAVGGAGAVSSLFLERVSGLLGTQVAQAARERWTALRGAELTELVLAGTLVESSELLGGQADELRALAERIKKQLEGT